MSVVNNNGNSIYFGHIKVLTDMLLYMTENKTDIDYTPKLVDNYDKLYKFLPFTRKEMSYGLWSLYTEVEKNKCLFDEKDNEEKNFYFLE